MMRKAVRNDETSSTTTQIDTGTWVDLAAVADGIVRVRYRPPGMPLPPPRSWAVFGDGASFGAVAPGGNGGATVETPLLRVSVDRHNGIARFSDASGRGFAEDSSPVSFAHAAIADIPRRNPSSDEILPEGAASAAAEVSKRLLAEEAYFGLGERTGEIERRGRIYSNWAIDPVCYHNPGNDNLYQSHPVLIGIRAGLSWAIVLAGSWYNRFDLGYTNPETLTIHTHGGVLDYFVLVGPDPAGVVEKLTRLTGRPFLPPRWALGYHQSRWGYKTEEDLRSIADEFRRRELPLDVIHCDIDYMRGYRVFSFDPQRFPEPKRSFEELRAKDVRVVPIVDPGVRMDTSPGYEPARQGLESGLFCTDAEGTPVVGTAWPPRGLWPDFAKEQTRSWWASLVAAFRGEYEVGGIWNDMNEPALFSNQIPLDSPSGGEDAGATHAETHNLYGHLMARATYDGLSAARPNERPWILTRSGCLGTQRYAAVWSGDNQSTWDHLEMSIAQLASMGLCGQPWVGADIGGFERNCPAELYARWIQFAVFYPFMRTHASFYTSRQEPWSFGPEVETIARSALELRYRLLPYLEALAHQTHETGSPILRPLVYDFSDDPATYFLSDQVMVGPELLVAPIYRPGKTNRAVYLPAGSWTDMRTGRLFVGPGTFIAEAPPTSIPVFVRGDAAVPLGNVRRSTAEPLSELLFHVAPAGPGSVGASHHGGGRSAGTSKVWRHIEDDGITVAASTATTVVTVSEDSSATTIRVAARQGEYSPGARRIGVAFPVPREGSSSGPAPGALLDGKTAQPAPTALPWGDGQWLAVSWVDDGRDHTVRFEQNYV